MTYREDKERELLINRLHEDLLGPSSADEQLEVQPSDRYLTGILYPERTAYGAEEDDDKCEVGSGDDDESDADHEAPPLPNQYKPSAMGLSFCLEREAAYGPAQVTITLSGGTYTKLKRTTDESSDRFSRSVWFRKGLHLVSIATIADDRTITFRPQTVPGLPHLAFTGTAAKYADRWIVTIAVVNRTFPESVPTEPSRDERALFQARLAVTCDSGWGFCTRPASINIDDDDARSAALIYRHLGEVAVGHTCSAEWDADPAGRITEIRSSWLPAIDVPMISSNGHDLLVDSIASTGSGLRAEDLMQRDTDMLAILESIPAGYRRWIGAQRGVASAIADDHLREQAVTHLGRCESAAGRIERGIRLLDSDPSVAEAFRLMNRALDRQWKWSGKGDQPFAWRPFQMAFVLQCLESIANAKSEDRKTMDLLWFPTGGGKTEAYLALVAFTVFLRRLRADKNNSGAGVASLMRYTLRLLTLQQFERAATMILAAEFVRRNARAFGESMSPLSAPISIGLWVGGEATPNTVREAIERRDSGSPGGTHVQIRLCPCCRQELDWELDAAVPGCAVRCGNDTCELGPSFGVLPLQTIDELIYENPPSLLIGTIDKFAQLLRKDASRSLLSPSGTTPPDLIIQDELHLISGSLGSIAGLYEAAIDAILARNGTLVKIIGSTATIRRADDQIQQLFDRQVALFPPAGLEAGDSCFATIPEPTERDVRRYVAISTAGRSAKFTLQAVLASLLQSATAVAKERRDAYWTLVAYFNSLRELGSANPLIADDVTASLALISARRGETQRSLELPKELTSRVSQTDIRDILEQLELVHGDDGAVDVLLATNMISVGVDVGRLGLMVVNGQPKTTAEYIQATSRVGRRYRNGLVVVVLNNSKARDRSNFESFRIRHQALYRGVEATSVTPFAPRARDKALHATLTLMARHLVTSLADSPKSASTARTPLDDCVRKIIDRIARTDFDEADAAAEQLADLVSEWQARAAQLNSYWNDRKPAESLLISAEQAVSRRRRRSAASAWPTLNSMRNVEESMGVKLLETGLRRVQT
jgi:hypothetical protein